ncbi:MAG: S8 family serine peptidase [Polyangiaceae bacterium]
MNNTWQVKSSAKTEHPKLDLRLCGLVELDASVFATAPKLEAVRDARRKGSPPVADGDMLRSGPLAFLRGPAVTYRAVHALDSGATVPVFVTVKSPDALKRLPCPPRSSAGCVGTMEVGQRELVALEASNEVVAIEWTGGVKPQGAALPMQTSVSPRRAVGIEEGSEPLDGAGTCVGIIDVDGLDFYHPDFIEQNGMTAVLAMWDQSVQGPRRGRAGSAPKPWGYGVEYTRREVYRELSPNQRKRYSVVDHEPLKGSHATKVASIATGRGAEDPEARGVAPGADLIFVNTVSSGPSSLAAMTELAEALDYVFQRAGERPCSVNISLGDNLGPHDGQSPVERFIDALLETPGRAVTVAAGNSDDTRKQARGSLGEGRPVAEVAIHLQGYDARSAVVEIWHDAAEGLTVEIVGPDGAGQSPPVAPTGLPCAFDVRGTRVLVGSVKQHAGTTAGHVRVELFPGVERGGLEPGRWAIRFSVQAGGTCDWHAWLDHPFATLVPGEGDSRPVISLTSPGTCESAITVGAYHPRTGNVIPRSGCGPSRRGTRKPELIAPGAGILAASAATPERYDPEFCGTSAAAPLVAGLVALLFQRSGKGLSALEARRMLIDAADPAGLNTSSRGHGAGRARLPARTGDDTTRNITSRQSRAEEQSRSMNMKDENKTKGAGGAANLSKSTDSLQMGIGFYEIEQGGIVVGKLLVLEGLAEGQTIEHWGLSPEYRMPSQLNRLQDLRFRYIGPPQQTAEAFKAGLEADTMYIQANCVQERIPETS